VNITAFLDATGLHGLTLRRTVIVFCLFFFFLTISADYCVIRTCIQVLLYRLK